VLLLSLAVIWFDVVVTKLDPVSLFELLVSVSGKVEIDVALVAVVDWVKYELDTVSCIEVENGGKLLTSFEEEDNGLDIESMLLMLLVLPALPALLFSRAVDDDDSLKLAMLMLLVM
jgi:hypothetical protein